MIEVSRKTFFGSVKAEADEVLACLQFVGGARVSARIFS